jgi:hypothetical protein
VDTRDKAVFWKYFIRADLLNSPKDIVKGFIQLFTKNSRLVNLIESYDKLEKELLNFCYLMQQFDDSSSIRLDDRREIEKDFNLKLDLPSNEEKWHINEAVVATSRANQEQTPEETIQTEETSNRVNNAKSKRDDGGDGMTTRQRMMIYDQLSTNQINMPTPFIAQPDVPYTQRTSNYPPNPNHVFTRPNEKVVSAASVSARFISSNPISVSTIRSEEAPVQVAKSFEDLDKSLTEMASSKMLSTSFRVDSLAEPASIPSEVFTSSELVSSDHLTETGLANLNTLRETLSNHDQRVNNRGVDRDYLLKIGRWGEQWVNQVLKNKYRTELQEQKVTIEWMNEIAESGLPYDFRLTFHSDSSVDNMFDADLEIIETDNVKFIEVKCTTKDGREAFPVSIQELNFAQKFSTQFEIYRVYNAANSDTNATCLKIVNNIPGLLNTHGIDLFIVI